MFLLIFEMGSAPLNGHPVLGFFLRLPPYSGRPRLLIGARAFTLEFAADFGVSLASATQSLTLSLTWGTRRWPIHRPFASGPILPAFSLFYCIPLVLITLRFRSPLSRRPGFHISDFASVTLGVDGAALSLSLLACGLS